jgi:hypothetical protein
VTRVTADPHGDRNDPDGTLFANQRGRPDLTPGQLRSRRQRNVAIGLAIGLLVVLFYAVTIVKMGPGVLTPPP